MVQANPSTITEAELTPGEYLVLSITKQSSRKKVDGNQIDTPVTEYRFFQVASAGDLHYEPLTLHDSGGNLLGTVSDASGVDFQRLRDSNGDDILRVPDTDFNVYHYSLGIDVSGLSAGDLRVYPNVQEDRNGVFDYFQNQPDPTTDEPVGWIDATETELNNPSIKFEQVSFKTGQLSPVQYGFFNDSGAGIDFDTLDFSVQGKSYALQPVIEKQEKLKLLAESAKPFDERDRTLRTVSLHPFNISSFPLSLPDEWQDSGNDLEVSTSFDPDSLLERN